MSGSLLPDMHRFEEQVIREYPPAVTSGYPSTRPRNQRKNAKDPWDYFKDMPGDELDRDYLVDRSLLAADKFEEFVNVRRKRIVRVVGEFLGR
jgi:hypothetical protein